MIDVDHIKRPRDADVAVLGGRSNDNSGGRRERLQRRRNKSLF